MIWFNDENVKYNPILKEALYYPDSLVNIVSITKLGLDTFNNKLKIQTFPTYSIFVQNHGQCTKYFCHS